MKKVVPLASAICLAALCAVAAQAQAPATSQPKAVRWPTPEQVAAAWPESARGRGVQGSAALSCIVSPQGETGDCTIVEETPAGEGFGQAALGLVPLYGYEPARVGDRPMRSQVRLTFAFRPPPPPPDNTVVPHKEIERPSPDQVFQAWPLQLRVAGIGGSAELDCVVNLQGRLEGCRVARESTPGAGFGPAALELAQFYRYEPGTRDGRPIAVATRIYVAFRCDQNCEPFQAPRGFTGPVVTVAWQAVPTLADIQAAYPAGARQAGRGGAATLFCEFRAEGTLRACRPAVETDPENEFLRAAVTLAERFKGPTAMGGGRSIAGAGVLLPIFFNPDQAALGRPAVSRGPTPQAFAAAYPPEALAAGVRGGQGLIGCTVGPAGGLEGCALVQETPAGLGFGAAALGLAPQFRMTLWSPDGRPTGGAPVQLPIRFELPSEPRPAADATVIPSIITRPEWERRPSPRDVDAAYPQRALRMNQTGQAQMRCRVNADGSIRDCVVAAETPPGFGFGQAALRLVPLFKMRPATVDGVPVEGASVNITIRFSGA